MGMDYAYLLYVARDALPEALHQLSSLTSPTGEPTTLALPDRTLTLPYSTWAGTPATLRGDDPAPTWQFALSMCFPPDEPIEDYLRPRSRMDPPGRYDDQGRAEIGYVYLTVEPARSGRTDGAEDELMLLSFGTPGSTMSVLFFESDSIRDTFRGLLAASRGVYGVFDMEDSATLFWWRGQDLDVSLPTAEMTLAEIEEYAGLTPPAAPARVPAATPAPQDLDMLPFTYQADEVVATAKHLRRTLGGRDLGIHHWVLALLDVDPVAAGDLPQRLGAADVSTAIAALRQLIADGVTGVALPEETLRQQAAVRAAREGCPHVSSREVAQAVGVLLG